MAILPDLHRADAVPDWEKIPESEWNDHQRRAAATNGWDTPGNRMTIDGAIDTLAGLALINLDRPWATVLGTALIGRGRKKDMEDGNEAERTGTKSPLGADLDASVDTMLIVAAAATLQRKEVVPRNQARMLLGLVGVKIAASVTGKALDREMRTSRAGKYGTFAHWGAVGLYCVARAAEHVGAASQAKDTRKLADGVMKVGIGLGAASAIGYIRDGMLPRRHSGTWNPPADSRPA